ncbi:MAG: hypothetical protein VYB44_07400 [Bacteroidota bacterium]|nr:hypothetical protein [Bacteroidota bacterium]
MALRDQPYIPLYVQDIMTDEKLNECSPATHGVYIKGIMCLMHKSEDYGKILLKQKYQQMLQQTTIQNHQQYYRISELFAQQIERHLPYTRQEIVSAITELLEERVLSFDGESLIQKRMVKDNEISQIRSKSAKKGAKSAKHPNNKTAKSASTKVSTKKQVDVEVFVATKPSTNPENEIEYENEGENVNEDKEGDKIENKEPEEIPFTETEDYVPSGTRAYAFMEPQGETFEAMNKTQRKKLNIQLGFLSKVDLPFQSQEFRESIYQLVEHKVLMKAEFASPMSFQKFFKQHEDLSEQEWISAIDACIASGWKTIYPKQNNRPYESNSKKLDQIRDTEVYRNI